MPLQPQTVIEVAKAAQADVRNDPDYGDKYEEAADQRCNPLYTLAHVMMMAADAETTHVVPVVLFDAVAEQKLGIGDDRVDPRLRALHQSALITAQDVFVGALATRS